MDGCHFTLFSMTTHPSFMPTSGANVHNLSGGTPGDHKFSWSHLTTLLPISVSGNKKKGPKMVFMLQAPEVNVGVLSMFCYEGKNMLLGK